MDIKTEKQLQAQIVVDFSQKRPEERGCLFAINNEAANNKHAQTLKVLGVHKGVSDLIYFSRGRMICIELKLPGKKHDADHIRRQYEWGSVIEDNSGRYYIVTSLESFWSVVNRVPDENVYTLVEIAQLLASGKRSIIFA